MSETVKQSIHGADKEIWRQKTDDHYSPSIHVTGDGKIGIAVNGHVIQKPIRWWHDAGMAELQWTKLNEDDPKWENITVTTSKQKHGELQVMNAVVTKILDEPDWKERNGMHWWELNVEIEIGGVPSNYTMEMDTGDHARSITIGYEFEIKKRS